MKVELLKPQATSHTEIEKKLWLTVTNRTALQK